MPPFVLTILTPVRWVIEAILVGFHSLLSVLGLDPAAGVTWVLSIVLLVIVVRSALIPVFVRQIKSQRRMMEVAPQIKKIQDKYKGKKDQFSREAMSRETMALYKQNGTNPLSSCLPLLIQMPIFFSLFSVINEAKPQKDGSFSAGVGFLSATLAKQFHDASLFGGTVPLRYSIQTAIQDGKTAAIVVAVVMVIIMIASQFFTQLQIMSRNQSPEMKASPMYRQQRILLYILPLVFAFSGYAFPIGTMFYWLTSNIWTMAQQFVVIRNMPTPGSEAFLAREARLARKNQSARRGITVTEFEDREPEAPKSTQRQQPIGKSRAKKQSGSKK